MKRFMALTLGLACSTAAYAGVTLDINVLFGDNVVSQSCTFDEQTTVWSLDHQGVTFEATAQEKDENTVTIACRVVRVTEAGEKIELTKSEFEGTFGEEMVLECSSTKSDRIIVKFIATKDADVIVTQ